MTLPALSPLSPLGRVLADMDRAIDARLYYPALLVALTIPEICSALALDKSVFVKQKHYAEFVNKYTTPQDVGDDGDGIYRLRGGVVHRASMASHPHYGATHVVFTTPETSLKAHAFSIQASGKTAAMFDLVIFCQAMKDAANKWYDDYKNHPKVRENMPNLIRYCPDGVHPFVVGGPVLASGEDHVSSTPVFITKPSQDW